MSPAFSPLLRFHLRVGASVRELSMGQRRGAVLAADRAERAITVKDGRYVSPGELPGDPVERMNLLERLARGLG